MAQAYYGTVVKSEVLNPEQEICMSAKPFRDVAILLCFNFLLLLSACSSDHQDDSNIKIGMQGRVRGGPEATIVAIDQESIRAFAKIKVANDDYGLRELIRLGKILSIPNGTKVLVIDTGWAGEAQVRVLEGLHTGRAVWTDVGWIVKDTGGDERLLPASKPDAASKQQLSPSGSASRQSLEDQLFSLLDDIIATEAGEKENPANVSTARALITQGANVNARSDLGDTPLIRATRSGHIQVMKVLLDKGADINAQDDRGMTALMWAAHMGDPEMTRILIAKGAKLNIKDNSGFTALSGAEGPTDKRHLEAIRLLKKAGAE